MDIEAGEYFAVVRGFEMGKMDLSFIFSGPQYDYMGKDKPEKSEEKPTYDRSYEGSIFQAIDVCGTMIAGKIVHSPYKDDVGKVVSLNTREIEVWPLSRKYVEAFGIK